MNWPVADEQYLKSGQVFKDWFEEYKRKNGVCPSLHDAYTAKLIEPMSQADGYSGE